MKRVSVKLVASTLWVGAKTQGNAFFQAEEIPMASQKWTKQHHCQKIHEPTGVKKCIRFSKSI